jgi:hypothetical protein
MAINFPDSPTNGQTYAVGSFTWQFNGEKWIGGNNITLDGLSNVSAATPSSGEVLQWNGTAWVPSLVVGPAGAAGAAGAPGADGADGDDGADGADGNDGATGLGYLVTSTSSVVFEGLGNKTFTLNTANHAYVTGMRVRAIGVNGADSSYVEGIATVSGTSMTINVDTAVILSAA